MSAIADLSTRYAADLKGFGRPCRSTWTSA